MKNKLRQEIAEKRKQLSKSDVSMMSIKIHSNLRSLDEYQNAMNVLFYVSYNNEVETRSVIQNLLTTNAKTIIVPYTVRGEAGIKISKLRSFDQLQEAHFGILEPKEEEIAIFDKKHIDLIIVPGTVFDRRGHRIGYGAGYYDIFLSTISKKISKVGLAYDFQIVDEIPNQKHDIPMDIIVTEKEVIRI